MIVFSIYCVLTSSNIMHAPFWYAFYIQYTFSAMTTTSASIADVVVVAAAAD